MARKPYRFPWAVTLALASFAILILYTYAKFIQVPYSGFYFNTSSSEIVDVYVDVPQSAALYIGDTLVQIGSLPFEQYRSNLRQSLFPEIQAGQVIPIMVKRDGLQITVPWVFPGFTSTEFKGRLLGVWWLAYVFWAMGMLALLFLRPQDTRWRLLLAFNFLTAVWLIAGSTSAGRVWDSAIVLRVAIWLCLPVYWHLHWNFPRPLGRLPAPLMWGLYLAGTALALAQWFEWLPPPAYFAGYLLAVAGSALLLVVHAVRRPEQRGELRILALAVGVVILPALAIGIAGLFGSYPWFAALGVLTLPSIPAAYLYAIYGSQLGGLQLRANRAISIALYVVLLFSILALAFSIVNSWGMEPGLQSTIGVGIALLAAIFSIIFYPRFGRMIEQRFLGMPIAPARLLETFADRILTSLDRQRLVDLLQKEALPSLLVRQAALLTLDTAGQPSPVFTLDVHPSQLPSAEDIPVLLSQSGGTHQPQTRTGLPLPWVHLSLPLKVDGELAGLMLFGRRDPDDIYESAEISILQGLADQVALALQNVDQAEQLHALFQEDIDRQETERLRLARDLHDDVLDQLALLAQYFDASPDFEPLSTAYQASVNHIRDIIHGLRPTMLVYGLRPALYELVDDMLEQTENGSQGEITVEVELSTEEFRYPEEVELHIFRIIQQASQNALAHAQARSIRIAGVLGPNQVDLLVSDDGVGFQIGGRLDLAGLLANRHYGLVGMYERATLIGAHLEVSSNPGKGTQVRIVWKAG